VALRLVGSPLRRVALLVLGAVPALYLSVATALLLLYAPHAVTSGLSTLAVLPFGCLLYAVIGAVFMLPTAIVPMVISALLISDNYFCRSATTTLAGRAARADGVSGLGSATPRCSPTRRSG
jgi:hypothetical protein